MKNWWRLFKKIYYLQPLDKKILLKVTLCLLFFNFTLKLTPFANFKKIFKHLTQTNTCRDYNKIKIDKIVHAITVASNTLPLNFTCLTQALVLKFLLRSDRKIVLTIGVALNTTFEAHAWVEKEGIYLIGNTPLTKFTPIWNWE